MSWLARVISRPLRRGSLIDPNTRIASRLPSFHRSYGKKSSSKKATSSSSYESPFLEDGAPVTTINKKGGGVLEVIPGSKNQFGDEFRVEWEKANKKMTACIDWFRKEVAGLETQGSGRVLPNLLDPVRVTLTEGGGSGTQVKLAEVATVGVKDGTTLIVTVFEEQNMKHVEKALYASRIPHIFPQKVDNRTLRIPIARPTVETRAALVTSAAKLAEDAKIRIRKAQQGAMKELKGHGHSNKSKGGEEMQALTDKSIADVDKIVHRIKKELAG